MTIIIRRIQFSSGKEIPDGTMCKITYTDDVAGAVAVELQLPGQISATRYENLVVEDECLTIPITSTFLSYAKEDRDFVDGLATRLLSDGVLTWFDKKDLLPGEAWKLKIDFAIQHCDGVLTWFDKKDLLPGEAWKLKIDYAIQHSDYFLTFFSDRSVSKIGYFQRELKYALEQQALRPLGTIFIIPVLLDHCKPPASLSDIQWLDVIQADWYSKLKSVVTRLP